MPNVTSNDTALGTRVRDLRRARGMRVEDLASTTRLASRTITRIESGKAAHLATLRLIADAFGITLADLIGEEAA